jgi:hypothetical protein
MENVILSDEKRRTILCPYRHTCTDCSDEQITRCENLCKESERHLLRILKTLCVRDWGKLTGEQIYDKLEQIEKEIEG